MSSVSIFSTTCPAIKIPSFFYLLVKPFFYLQNPSLQAFIRLLISIDAFSLFIIVHVFCNPHCYLLPEFPRLKIFLQLFPAVFGHDFCIFFLQFFLVPHYHPYISDALFPFIIQSCLFSTLFSVWFFRHLHRHHLIALMLGRLMNHSSSSPSPERTSFSIKNPPQALS